MFEVVMHDYMLDGLKDEFTIVYGNTEQETVDKAWEKLQSEIDDSLMSQLKTGDGKKLTKRSFTKYIVGNWKARIPDAIYISGAFPLYAKMFEIPKDVD